MMLYGCGRRLEVEQGEEIELELIRNQDWITRCSGFFQAFSM